MLETNFEQCALASGLVSKEHLEAVWKELSLQPGILQPEDIPLKLSEALIHRQIINSWQAQQLLAGRFRFTLGLYRIIDSVGHGGMGQVFKARHTVLNRIVAIKVLPLAKSTPAAIENFQQEIQAMASLDHPNLVKAIDAGKDASVYYLVCEYVPGPDLRKYIRRQGMLSQEIAASIFVQVAAGLQHAHDAGLVHRDVKPGNILISMDGVAKLSDLGLASPCRQNTEIDTKEIKVVGTADYISPDHFESPGNPKPIWDIYSLGCSLYYAVTGKVPYPGGTTLEKVNAHRDPDSSPLDPQRLNPLLSNDFVTVLGEMMAKNPQDRIPSAKEVIRRLRPWSDGTPRPLILSNNEESSLSLSPATAESQGIFVSDFLSTSSSPPIHNPAHTPAPSHGQARQNNTFRADPLNLNGNNDGNVPKNIAIPPSVSPDISYRYISPPSPLQEEMRNNPLFFLNETPKSPTLSALTPQNTPPAGSAEEENLSSEDIKKMIPKILIFFLVIPVILIFFVLLLWSLNH
ncbi:MAG: serine/threonine-protein kinase [Planctomycetia bacterium]|nr:serine/threonine-protein kinase [Planctomycetia bacterium]